MTVYRGQDGDVEPVPVEYDLTPEGTLPEFARDGKRMWRNTHFYTEEAAWLAILAGVAAGVRLCASHVERSEKQLRDAYEAAGKMAVEYKTAYDNHRAWLSTK